MKKRTLVLGLVALLVVIAGTWGVLSIRAHTSARASSRNGTAHGSPTGQTSLYLTGTLVIPTVKLSPPTTNLCSIPTFTAQDVRQYMRTVPSFNGMRIRQTSPNYILTRILFITNQVANDPNGLNADTGVSDPGLIVCYVEVYGTFRVEGGPPIPTRVTPTSRPVYHHGQLVFDGVTGNVLDIGVRA